MSNDTTYNGWANYETWLVKVWMDNDQGSQEYWADLTKQLVDAENTTQDILIVLCDELKTQHEGDLPDLEGFAADLLNAAMSAVNWREIALSLVEDSQDS